MGVWSVDLETRREELMLPLADAIAEQIQGAGNGMVAEPSLSRSMTSWSPWTVDHAAAREPADLPQPDEGRSSRVAVSDPSQWVGYPAWSPDETQPGRGSSRTAARRMPAVLDASKRRDCAG